MLSFSLSGDSAKVGVAFFVLYVLFIHGIFFFCVLQSYPENPAEFKPLTGSDLQKIKNEKKQKEVQRKQKLTDNRRHLAAIRVLQRNLVFVVGLSQRLSDPEVSMQQKMNSPTIVVVSLKPSL